MKTFNLIRASGYEEKVDAERFSIEDGGSIVFYREIPYVGDAKYKPNFPGHYAFKAMSPGGWRSVEEITE